MIAYLMLYLLIRSLPCLVSSFRSRWVSHSNGSILHSNGSVLDTNTSTTHTNTSTTHSVTAMFRRCSSSVRISNLKIMLIIAHPDDECMFFAPLLAYCAARGIRLLITVCTNGGLGGDPETRKKEAQKIHGNSDSLIELHFLDQNDGSLKPTEKLTDILCCIYKKTQCSGIITFDALGVSGHPDHIACFKIAQKVSGALELPGFWTLRTQSLFWKYCISPVYKWTISPAYKWTISPVYKWTISPMYRWIASLAVSVLIGTISCTPMCNDLALVRGLQQKYKHSESVMLINGPRESIQGRARMLEYTSQMKWYRYLYLAFSTYMDAVEIQLEQTPSKTKN